MRPSPTRSTTRSATDRAVRIIGDGVAGLLVAAEARRRGIAAFVIGEGAEPPPGVTALVHPFAGRSLQTSREEVLAWRAAEAVLERFVELGWATRNEMRRPLDGDAGRRLLRSFERDRARLREQWGVAVVEDALLGQCLRYEPAFGVDMGAALRGLRSGANTEPAPFDITVLAVGARLSEWVAGDDLRVFGGELAVVDATVSTAISGRGVHIVPTLGGAPCAGATWWTESDRPNVEDAAADIASRLEGLLGAAPDVTTTWSGRRCVYQPDRRPIVGWLDERTIVAGALGSRGWLWAPLIAAQVVDALQGFPLLAELDVARTSLRLVER